MQLGYLFASKPHTSNKVRLDNIKNSLLEQNYFLVVFIDNTNLNKNVKCFPVKDNFQSCRSPGMCPNFYLNTVSCGCRVCKAYLMHKPMVGFLCKDKIVIDISLDKT